jgi:small subunit ribosomal protein S7
MPRRNRPPKRDIAPDIKYNSVLVARFINKLMQHGKKSTAQRIFYDALDIVEGRAKRPGLDVFEQAIKNVTPIIEVKPRRVGGATYQVPVEVRSERQSSLAIRWLVDTTRNRPGKTMAEKLANEIMDAASNTGQTVKKREDTHRMAEANRAFAHYRW